MHTYSNIITCSFQTCLRAERVDSFQHKDVLSSAISLSVGSLALAAHLQIKTMFSFTCLHAALLLFKIHSSVIIQDGDRQTVTPK